jgi:hypothetical protein
MTKKTIGAILVFLILTIGTVCSSNNDKSNAQIKLDAFYAYANQHQKDNFSYLIDDNFETKYTVWNPKIKPYIITFPLYSYERCIIKQLRFSINNGNHSTQKYYYVRRDNGEKILFHSYSGGAWTPGNPIKIFNVPSNLQADASAFIIESEGGSDFPEDVELYGEFITAVAVHPPSKRLPLSELMGVVLKPWDIASDYMFPEKIPAIQELGTKRVRLYDDYQLNHNANGDLIFDHNLWHQTANIKILKNKGISTQQCYLATQYYPFTGDKLRPETYVQLAKDVYAFGLHNKANGDLVKIFEVENELNRWYGDFARDYMDGYQLATMMSVCYDGHKGKYPNVGLKASGSIAMLSLPGLAEAEPYIFYQIAEWSIKNRGYRNDGTIDFPFDVYSFHLYSSLEGQRQGIPGGIAPEYGMAPYLKKINHIRNRLNKNIRVHVGEWGWDVSPNSPLNAPAFGKYSAQQTSAMWTVRALLSMAENEINGSSYYRIKQDYDAKDDNSEVVFATMALIRQESGGVKQPDGSYIGLQIHRTLTGDYFKQLSEFFNSGWIFDSRVSASPNVLKFKKDTSEMYVIWEAEKMTISNRPQFRERTGAYLLNVRGKIRRLVDNGSGIMGTEEFAGGEIIYGSKPIFVVTKKVIQD